MASTSFWPSSAEILFLISRLSRSAELVGAKPLHLPTQTARRLKAPLGLSLLRKRGALQTHFHPKGRYGKLHLYPCCADAPEGSQRQQMPFLLTAPPVKRQIEKIRRFFRFANKKFYFRYLWPKRTRRPFSIVNAKAARPPRCWGSLAAGSFNRLHAGGVFHGGFAARFVRQALHAAGVRGHGGQGEHEFAPLALFTLHPDLAAGKVH